MRKLFAAVAALTIIGCAGTREARVEDRERYSQSDSTNDQMNRDPLDDDQRFDQPGMGGAGSEGVGNPGIDPDRETTPSVDDFGAGGSRSQDDLGTGGAGMGEDDVGAGMDGELENGGRGTRPPGTGTRTPGTGTGTGTDMNTGGSGTGSGSDMGTGGSGTGGSATRTDEMDDARERDARRNPLRPGTTTIQGQTIEEGQ